tara:strand:+ start:932 stop:1825 length:894 start_codon:yes stop_codon:yes gene_type:complete
MQPKKHTPDTKKNKNEKKKRDITTTTTTTTTTNNKKGREREEYMFLQHGGTSLIKLTSAVSCYCRSSSFSCYHHLHHFKRGGGGGGRRMYSSSSPTAMTKAKKQQPKEDKTEGGGGEYNPEKTAIVDGKKYRKCACAIVFNDSGSHVLVGERAGKSGSWNLPQGGMEPKETTAEAATRELYEETGISLDSSKNKKNIQVELLSVLENDDAYAYSAGGWLEKKGLAGQRLEFAVFRCKTSADPMEFVNLEGLDGEPAEFTQMKWMSLDECVESVWEAKKKAYEKMRVNVEPIVRKHFY